MEFRYHLDQINEAVAFVENNTTHSIICFNGPMGSGKTTLISSLCKKWKVTDPVSSPTFSLVNHYESPSKGSIFHFDFYRLNHPDEALDFGVNEYLDNPNPCLIEWGERIEKLLPIARSSVDLQINEDQSRTLKITNR